MKTVVLLLILFAAWAKSAQFPLYMWLPSAMEAPTPVSAYLHGASMVKVGVCVFARALASAGDTPEIVGWSPSSTRRDHALRLPHVPAPEGYEAPARLLDDRAARLRVLRPGPLRVRKPDGVQRRVEHIFNHAFTKTLFFLIAGSLSFTLGTRMLPKIQGLMKKYPVTGVGFAVAATAIAGVPP